MKWRTVELGSVSEVVSGFGFPREYQGESIAAIPFFKVGDMNLPGNTREMKEWTNAVSSETLLKLGARALPSGTVIFPKIGAAIATGKKRLLACEATFDNNVMGLVPNEVVEPRFLYYWTLTFDFTRISNMGPVPSIRKSTVERLPFSLPSRTEQRRIVEILDRADTLRQKRVEANDKAERILPTIFYKMIGDPTANHLKWEVTTLSRAGVNVRYGLGQPPALSSIGIPMIRATNIHKGQITDQDMIRVDPKEVPKDRNAFLVAEEVLVVRSGAYTGDVAQVTKKWAGSVAGYDLVVSPGPNFCGEYIETYLLMPHIQKNHFGRLKARAGQPHINATQLLETPILRPPKPLQLAFASKVWIIRDLSKAFQTASTSLDRLFTSLLHRAFSSEFTKKWREAHMKQVLAEMEEQDRVLVSIDKH